MPTKYRRELWRMLWDADYRASRRAMKRLKRAAKKRQRAEAKQYEAEKQAFITACRQDPELRAMRDQLLRDFGLTSRSRPPKNVP